MIVQNPGASAPLVIPLNVEVNTSLEKIRENVVSNSRRARGDWVYWQPEHDRVAIICGGGPSLRESLASLHEVEGDIFALNGAATFLSDHGIKADYQVIMDAQPATAGLVGPAKKHLFASQVDPACFDKKPDAILWHATVGEYRPDEPGFMDYDKPYTLIGSSVSVGNTALVLLYVLGYRKIHIFGMDSSHRDGHGHAYAQAMNDGDPCTIVEYRGKQYYCSVTMHLQAKHFVRRAAQLAEAGCYIIVHGSGLLPDMMRSPPSERDKYRELWTGREYRGFSPGEAAVDQFLSLIPKWASITDYGCGTGRAALKMHEAGHPVWLVDFADNCRDPAAEFLPFTVHDLTEKPFGLLQGYGFCADVMEHIAPADVEKVIGNIMHSVSACFFQISTVPDSMGEEIGQVLHLTVKPHEWWKETFGRLGYEVSWEDRNSIASSFFVKKRELDGF